MLKFLFETLLWQIVQGSIPSFLSQTKADELWLASPKHMVTIR